MLIAGETWVSLLTKSFISRLTICVCDLSLLSQFLKTYILFSDLWFISVSHAFHKMSSFVEHREINVLFIFLFIRGS